MLAFIGVVLSSSGYGGVTLCYHEHGVLLLVEGVSAGFVEFTVGGGGGVYCLSVYVLMDYCASGVFRYICIHMQTVTHTNTHRSKVVRDARRVCMSDIARASVLTAACWSDTQVANNSTCVVIMQRIVWVGGGVGGINVCIHVYPCAFTCIHVCSCVFITLCTCEWSIMLCMLWYAMHVVVSKYLPQQLFSSNIILLYVL